MKNFTQQFLLVFRAKSIMEVFHGAWMLFRGYIPILCRLLLAGVFGYAGIEKILEPGAFADSIAAYRLLPDALVNPVALVLPVVEVALALALFVPKLRKTAAGGIGVLLLIFMAGLAQAWARGIVLNCGCFGGDSTATATSGAMAWAVVRDAGLLGAARMGDPELRIKD
jgi:uncharacterized membrane protein YphA (DoxX/SURF4 family)